MSTKRTLSVLASVVLYSAVLAACSGDAAGRPNPPVATSGSPDVAVGPQVGDCWFDKDLTSPLILQRGGSAAVECIQRHKSITYAVGALPDDASYPLADVGAWPRQIQTKVRKVCDIESLQTSLARWHDSRIEAVIYLPSRAEWTDGERWVRCDVMVRRIGSKDADALKPSRAYEDLPASFNELAVPAKDVYDKCSTNPEDPRDSAIVDCSRSRVKRVVAEVEYPKRLTVPANKDGQVLYMETFQKFGDRVCGAYAGEDGEFEFAANGSEVTWLLAGPQWLSCRVVS